MALGTSLGAERVPRPHRGGFALLEVLIALAIFAIAGVVLFAMAGEGLDRQGRAERLLRATSIAESLLARLGQELPLQIGRLQGEAEDRIAWAMTLRPASLDTEKEPSGPRLLDIELILTWTEGLRERQLRLVTRRLATS